MSANEMPHLFAGEVQFRRYSDTSTQGQQIVLSLADREALQPFIGLEGKRLMAVFVLIGDDEQPEPPPAKKSEKPLKEGPRRKLGPICEWLVYRCKEPEFQQWIRGPYDRAMGGDGKGWGDVHPDHFSGGLEQYARHAVLVLCDVSSRSEIDGNADAETRFESLIRKPWAAHTKAAERHAIADR